MKAFLLSCAALALGALASEGFMRAIVEPEALFEFSFTPGAQSPSKEFGFVFTPNWSGYMRHPDHVWGVPIAFEEHGYRLPAYGELPGDPTRVVLLGGRSTAMCYGLPDYATIHHRMAQDAKRPLEVWDTGWAGFDIYRSWKYFQEGLGSEKHFDVALLCINPQEGYLFAKSIPEDLGPVHEHPLQDVMFSLVDGYVRVPTDDLERWMGKNYFRSYVLYGFLRYRKDIAKNWNEWTVRLGLGSAKTPPRRPPEQQAELDREGLLRLGEFLRHVDAWFRERKGRLAVLLMPSSSQRADTYSEIEAAIPEGIPYLDLHREFFSTFRPQDYIGLGHYDDEQAHAIADRLLRFLDQIEGDAH